MKRTTTTRVVVASPTVTLTGERVLCAYNLVSNGSAACTVIFYKGSAAAGNELWRDDVLAGGRIASFAFPPGSEPVAEDGLAVVLSGTGSEVHFVTR